MTAHEVGEGSEGNDMTDMHDQELETLAQRLGEGAAARLDVGRTAEAVVERLRAEGRRVTWWRRPAILLQVAATVAVVVTAAEVGRRVVLAGPAVEGAVGAVGEGSPAGLETLSADDLVEVLDSLSLAAPPSERRAGLHDLTDGQLQELLRTMEGA